MTWQVPDTRPSILMRVQDQSDEKAWAVFESIYRPAIFRAARRRHLQVADAEDVSQIVLARLAQRTWRFAPSSGGAKFRTWLARVTENAIIDHCRSQRRRVEPVSIETESSINDSSVRDCLELEYRREVFHWAVGIIRREFSSDAWQSFWLTAVENRGINEVALELNRSIGSVYSSRSRIMRRLKFQVSQFDDGLDGEL